MAWKYVIVQVGNSEVPVVFPSRLVHAMVVDAIKDLFVMEAKMVTPKGLLSGRALGELRDSIVAVGAGDCEMIVTSASGSSETLKVRSRPGDKDAINTNPYTGGIL